tara:strand:- start:4216 stop:5139 length:924 start_codon:yes stop_codon:yes gene_type:complete
MAILTTEQQAYYGASGEHGEYRYLSLADIIDSFTASYVGKGKICEGVVENDVAFHAIRALQELSYDTLKTTKDWEVEVPSTLVLVMPHDYVNYVKLSWSDNNGTERVIYPTSKTSNPLDITLPVDSATGGFTLVSENDELTGDESSDTLDKYSSVTSSDLGSTDSDEIDDEYGRLVGGRYGIDPQHAQANGSFFIDEDAGKFHFSSNLSGKTLILRYLSDGIVTSNASGSFTLNTQLSLVPKFAEEAIYRHILYGTLFARKDTPAGLLAQIKKEKFAETRKAKLRLSNIKIEELTQILRGSSKQIKH